MRSSFEPHRRAAAWLLPALLALTLAACAPAAAPSAAPPTQAAEPPPVAAPTQAQALAPPTAQAANPLPDDQFRPSDPAQVNLAAGRPQFVEFFAFW